MKSLEQFRDLCEALGAERVNEELIPMITDMFEELDDDEKFINFVETFKKLDMVALLGGPDRLLEIYDLVFVLLVHEEQLVRQKT